MKREMEWDALRDQYRAEHRWCEVSGLIHDSSFKPTGIGGLELHHIFSRRLSGSECPANYLMVCPAAHRWGHDGHPNEFRIACLTAKFEAGNVHLPSLDALARVPLEDYVEALAGKITESWKPKAERLLRLIRASRMADEFAVDVPWKWSWEYGL